jgi:hypothetical protein
MAALRDRIGELDAVVVGPYLYGLTHDVATAFAEKTVLLPCFHDEPAARLAAFRQAYRQVGSILYHTAEEQAFAEMELGLNHPGAAYAGTFLPVGQDSNPVRPGSESCPTSRYLVYCGRYSPHKNLPLLLEYARRYDAARPGRFKFVFIGQGEINIPREPWARDLGFVADPVRRATIAGADALVQLSRNESLSLVALEAWAHGVPVVADAGCSVLAGQLGRCGGGGRLVGSYQAFATALDDLWDNPGCWSELGARGRAFVQREFASQAALAARIEQAFRELSEPLAEKMRRRGRARAGQFTRAEWRQAFARVVEEWLHAPEQLLREEVRIQPRASRRCVRAGCETILLPLRIVNQGTHALAAEGPTGVTVCCRVEGADGKPAGMRARTTPLPGLLLPGRAVNLAATVSVPADAGRYRIRIRLERTATDLPSRFQIVIPAGALLPLEVEGGVQQRSGPDLFEPVDQALVAAEQLHRLPDDYHDVTQGWLASWKRRAKEKLLNNFKHAYVDVLSRQQTAFNRQLLTAVQELAEGFSALWQKLESNVAVGQDSDPFRTGSESCPAAVEERIPS